jgi:hypothetical protein
MLLTSFVFFAIILWKSYVYFRKNAKTKIFVSTLILDQEENQNEAVVAPQANTNLPNVEDIKRRLGHVLQLVKIKLVKV